MREINTRNIRHLPLRVAPFPGCTVLTTPEAFQSIRSTHERVQALRLHTNSHPNTS